jgi:hypothetical protein
MTEQLKALFPVLGILLVGICVVGLALAWLGVLPGSAREEETVEGEAAMPTSTVQSSPLDATESVGIQTATFALG